jgi:hypothetical protein
VYKEFDIGDIGYRYILIGSKCQGKKQKGREYDNRGSYIERVEGMLGGILRAVVYLSNTAYESAGPLLSSV